MPGLLVIAVLTAPDNGSDVAASPAPHTSSPKPTQLPKPTAEPQPQRASVPLLTGMTLQRAREELRADHLKTGFITRRPSAAQPGTVLSQGLRRGKQVVRLSVVPLVVAVPLPRVPAVSGQSGTVGAQALISAGFRVRTVRKTVTAGTEGVVLSESPSAGQPARPGALITMVVAHVVRPVTPTPTQTANCTPGYSPCLPPAYDYDCSGGSGDGPQYTGLVRVTGSDPYGLDADGDGWGCTSP